MRFRCSNCGVDHDVRTDNALVNPGGTMAHFPWYRENNGLNINATICLRCGTVHATSGAALKGLLTFGSRLLNVQYYIPIDKLRQLIEERGNPLPPAATGILVSRGFLVGTTQPVQAANDAQGQGMQAAIMQAIQASLAKFAMFCVMMRHGEFSGASVEAFLQHSKGLEEEGIKNAHTMAADMFRDMMAGGTTPGDIAAKAEELYNAAG